VAIQRRQHAEVCWCETDEHSLKLATAAQIQDHLNMQPQDRGAGKRVSVRVVVVVDAEILTTQATNRLLKIFEEPPAFARIILTTSCWRRLLPTIRSRAIRWQIHAPTAALAAKVEPALAELLAPRDPLRVLRAADEVAKNLGWSADRLVKEVELALNQDYRRMINVGDQANYSPAVIRQRRQLLSTLRELATKRRTAINAQLSAENLGWAAMKYMGDR